MSIDVSKISLAEPSAELYNEIADSMAKAVSDSGKSDRKEKNKSTQLRKFYDEIVMWDQRVKTNPDKFNEYLPLIRMINAKVAYAKGRELVDDEFFNLMKRCISQVTDAKTFGNCKKFLEAFMGFYKMYQPK
jgi:CRISPR-associated protein Csm2